MTERFTLFSCMTGNYEYACALYEDDEEISNNTYTSALRE